MLNRRLVRLTLFIVSVMIMSLGISIMISVFPYFILSLKIEMKLYGLIGTVSSLIILFFRIPFSSLMPAMGYFRTFTLGYLLVVSSRVFYIIASIGISSILFFAIGVFLSRFYFPISAIVRGSVIARYFESNRRAFMIGIISSLSLTASSIGPFIGSYLYEYLNLSFETVFLTSLLVMLTGLLPLFFLFIKDDTKTNVNRSIKEEFLNQIRAIPKILRYKRLFYSFLVFELDAFSWSLIRMYSSIYIAQVLGATPTDQAFVSLIRNIIGILSLGFSGYLSDRAGKRIIFLILSEICGVIYMGLYVSANSMLFIYIAAIFMGFVMSFWGPIATAYITDITDELSPILVPLAIGVWGFLGSIARMPGPLIGGYLYDISPRLPFSVSLFLLAAEIILLNILNRIIKK